MNDSMYKGKSKFTREQVIFMCEAAMAAAFARIESSLPPNIYPSEYKAAKTTIDACISSALDTAGMNLAIIFAQLTDDGIGIADAYQTAGFDKAVEKFVKQCSNRRTPYRQGELCHPDCRKMAEKYVNYMFKDYPFRKEFVEHKNEFENVKVVPVGTQISGICSSVSFTRLMPHIADEAGLNDRERIDTLVVDTKSIIVVRKLKE